MTWTPHGPRGHESQKIWPLVIPYARGKGLDIGCGSHTCLPHMIGLDSGKEGWARPGIKGEAHDLELFADASLDFIFSSHLLEHIDQDLVPEILARWHDKIKLGGYIILYVPNSDDYPKVGEPGSNPDHKWDIYPDSIYDMLNEDFGHGWLQIEHEVRSEGHEYSIFEVYQKTNAPMSKSLWRRNPDGRERAIVLRYGAIGDMMIASSVLPKLREEGYHVTVNTNPLGAEILENDPNVDEIIVQTQDMTEGDMLHAYWDTLPARYDRIINLNHSLEGLALGHDQFSSKYWDIEARRDIFGAMNYEEMASKIARTGKSYGGIFHTTAHERKWAKDGVAAAGGPVVVWQIAGSSLNKVYPFVDTVAGWLADEGVTVIFTGGEGVPQVLERAILECMFQDKKDTTKIAPRCGKWSIRKSITMAMHADCVVGPETGVLNAVAHWDVPKVVYLSHSNHENLTKHWTKTAVLMPDRGDCPCYPCHMIHKSWDTCNQNLTTKAAQCASSIAPSAVYNAVMLAVASSYAKRTQVDVQDEASEPQPQSA